MNGGDALERFSDAQLVERFREASLERARCGFNAVKGNRIVDLKMTPALNALKARGPHALQKLLALTEDSDPNVRADAAIYGYDVDPTRCQEVLRALIGEQGLPGIAAVVWLIDKDPDFRAEFGAMGGPGPDDLLRDFDRRYPPKEKN